MNGCSGIPDLMALLRSLFRRISIFFFTGIACLSSCSSPGQKEAQEAADSFASLDTSTQYVGMNTCRQCHNGIYESYIRTGMGRSFGTATLQRSAADFSKESLVHDRYRDLRYHPFWNADSLRILEFRMSNRDTVYRREETVDYIVGSGQHTNSHLIQLNGYLFQAPMTFYTQQKTWDLPPGFENGHNSRFSRKIEMECLTCHNAYPRLVQGSENKYEFIPQGIDCERCHGPGSKHVAEKQSGLLIDTSTMTDYSIVNPAKLAMDLQLDICQRCHVQGNVVLKKGKSFTDFRPGMRLSDAMSVFMPVYKGQEGEHIMASHAERMKMSKCFSVAKLRAEKSSQQSLRPYKNAMTCVTCHNPHVSVRETGSETFNNACKSCHNAEKKDPLCSAPESLRKIENDNCTGCHMPRNKTIDIPHVVTTDHFIRIPVDREEVTTIREFLTLASINEPRPDDWTRGVAFLNYYEKFVQDPVYLDSAKHYLADGTPADISANFGALVRWAFLKNAYDVVVRYVTNANHHPVENRSAYNSMEEGWTAYRIGESYYKTGDLTNATAWLKRAVGYLPYQLDFRNRYASVLQDAGNSSEAAAQYEFILTENPGHVSACVDYGYLFLTRMDQPLRSEALYNQALRYDPDHIQAMINKSGLMVIKGQTASAIELLKRVLVLDPGNGQAKKMLNLLK